MSDYSKRPDKAEPWVGYGTSIIPHGGGFTGDGEAAHIKAVVKLRKEVDHSVTILVSNVEMGQGAMTALSKIVASVLDISLERVHYEVPDTFLVPDSGPTVASRTTMVVGGLLAKAAERLKPHMTVPGDLIMTEDFKQPDYIQWNQETLQGSAYMAYSWSALLARVEVDPISYEVKCTDIWGAYDVGVPIDDKLIIGQIQGGIIQGLGYALMENMTSKQGRIEQIAFSSYSIPTSMDIPTIHADWILNGFEDGPFGAKSAGELTLVGVAPAVAAAIENALGIVTHQIPVTPEVIERTL
jgi:CO/xanthine dehydrogenase Mo-binding subunit